jgi:hypothetical protein
MEVGESFWGSGEEGMRGRRTESKVLLVIAAQEDGKGIGRIRMRRIPDASAQSLMPFVEDAILNPAVWFIPTAGRDTIPWKGKATGTVSPS